MTVNEQATNLQIGNLKKISYFLEIGSSFDMHDTKNNNSHLYQDHPL